MGKPAGAQSASSRRERTEGAPLLTSGASHGRIDLLYCKHSVSVHVLNAFDLLTDWGAEKILQRGGDVKQKAGGILLADTLYCSAMYP